MNSSHITKAVEWTKGEKFFFRAIFLYFIIQAVPLDWKYFLNISRIEWHNFGYRDLFYLARYTPQFFDHDANAIIWGLNSLQDWLVAFTIALIGAITWTYLDRKRTDYNDLYYLMRVILRYRLALGIIAYGFIHLFPVQLPYPSLSLKNTNYGEFTDWKIASVSYGVAPGFESFLGIFEVLGGILLLHRKSASIGAVIIIGFVGNVFLSNLAYGGGETVYSLYLLTIAVPIVYYDLFRWHRIIMLGRPSLPHLYSPAFYVTWKYNARIFLRTGFFIFLILFYGSFAWASYRNGGYQYPGTAGLHNTEGLYNVSEFRLNGRILPYSLTDTFRWQDVVFEKWATLSIRSNHHPKADLSNTEEIFVADELRNYESSGSMGRHFYRYTVDSANNILQCYNKNKNGPSQKLFLHYDRPNQNRIILTGVDDRCDSIYAVLDKIKKVYLLDESYKIPQNRSVFE
jgi:hypothetical protein